MGKKLIALGNSLMGDDGIAIRVAKGLEKSLKEVGIEVIIAETDIDFAIECIVEGDIIFILDATLTNKQVGEISIMPIEKTFKACTHHHEISLLELIKFYNIQCSGVIIGIEVQEINFSNHLSRELEDTVCNICKKVLNTVKGFSH